jgi:hypothetical protein
MEKRQRGSGWGHVRRKMASEPRLACIHDIGGMITCLWHQSQPHVESQVITLDESDAICVARPQPDFRGR